MIRVTPTAITAPAGLDAEIAQQVKDGSIAHATATAEIAHSVQQAASGTTQVSDHLGDLTSAAQEAGQASIQVLEAAREVASDADQVRRVVDAFIAKVRAG